MSYAEQNYTIDELTEVINGAATGIPPANMQQFSVSAGDTKVSIVALEPADTEVDGQLVASCKGFKIVMNDDHYPVDETDGTVVADHVATGDTYTTEVTGLTNDTQYYFAAFPYTDHGVVNRAAGLRVLAGSHPNRQTATPKAYVLYGFKRTKADSNPATRVVATDMAVGLTPASMNASTGEINLGGWANAWFVTGNKPVIIIDYLQILAPYSDRASDKQNTDKAVLELKRISRDCKIPVIAISSLNRSNYNMKISMEAFKESGAIEYSSDVLIGLQLEGVGQGDFDNEQAKRNNPREIELVILKNRNGATGEKVPFDYYTLFNYFKEAERGDNLFKTDTWEEKKKAQHNKR